MSVFTGAGAARLDDRDYGDFVLAAAETARVRILAAVFLHDLRPARDLRGRVLELTRCLAARRAVGVDVRVLLTGHARTPDIAVANLAAGHFLRGYGVPHRRCFAVDEVPRRRGLHSKFAVFDDTAVVGSQNWTDDAFVLNAEDALVLDGPPVHRLVVEFDRLWRLGRGMPDHAS